MLQKFSLVDIETTGLSSTSDRIIEIAIITMQNDEITNQFSTLVNPGVHIPKQISTLTGILPHHLHDAPYFEDIQYKIESLLSESIFVAHNARFDYSFIKNEFERAGNSFHTKTLCTVKLSRKLYPGLQSYSLSNLISALNIKTKNTHRAKEDAMALWHLIQKAKSDVGEKAVFTAIDDLLKSPRLPLHLNKLDIQDLPETWGVYKFYGEDDSLLYIGKSNNLSKRVRSHFTGDYRSGTEMKLANEVKRIEVIKKPGELSSLITESQLVKSQKPLHNKLLRKRSELLFAKKLETSNSFAKISVEKAPAIFPEDLNSVMAIFKNSKSAKDYLYKVADKYNLCLKLLGLDNSTGVCFNYQIQKCSGACLGKDDPLAFNMRLAQAFANTKIKPWPFKGKAMITEKNNNQSESFTFNNWCLFTDNTSSEFDLDIYKILVKFLYSKKLRHANYSILSAP